MFSLSKLLSYSNPKFLWPFIVLCLSLSLSFHTTNASKNSLVLLWKYMLSPLAFLYSTVSAIIPSPFIFYLDYGNYFLNNSHLLCFLPPKHTHTICSCHRNWNGLANYKSNYSTLFGTLQRLHIVSRLISKSLTVTLHDLIFVCLWSLRKYLILHHVGLFRSLESDKVVPTLGPLYWISPLGSSSLIFLLSWLLLIRY